MLKLKGRSCSLAALSTWFASIKSLASQVELCWHAWRAQGLETLLPIKVGRCERPTDTILVYRDIWADSVQESCIWILEVVHCQVSCKFTQGGRIWLYAVNPKGEHGSVLVPWVAEGKCIFALYFKTWQWEKTKAIRFLGRNCRKNQYFFF